MKYKDMYGFTGISMMDKDLYSTIKHSELEEAFLVSEEQTKIYVKGVIWYNPNRPNNATW